MNHLSYFCATYHSQLATLWPEHCPRAQNARKKVVWCIIQTIFNCPVLSHWHSPCANVRGTSEEKNSNSKPLKVNVTTWWGNDQKCILIKKQLITLLKMHVSLHYWYWFFREVCRVAATKNTANHAEAAAGIRTGRLETEKGSCLPGNVALLKQLMEAPKGGGRKHTNVDFNRGPSIKHGELMRDMKGCFLFLSVLLHQRQMGKYRSAATVNSHVKKIRLWKL